MKVKNSGIQRRQKAYTLIEMMFAIGITSVMFFAGMSAITFSKIQLMKDKERAIVSDFAVHYLEMIRGLPFDSVAAGNPINPIYDGVNATETGYKIAIRVPASADWISLNTSDYQHFTPDLLKISVRNPEMSFAMDTTSVAGQVRTRHIALSVRWDSPLGNGNKNVLRMDLCRLRDLEVMQ